MSLSLLCSKQASRIRDELLETSVVLAGERTTNVYLDVGGEGDSLPLGAVGRGRSVGGGW
jgi:hypothetical protein